MARSIIEYGYLDKVFDLNVESEESERIETRNSDIYI